MAWGFGNSGNQSNLTPPGVGNISKDQMNMFASAAQSSGLADMAMNQVDQITSGMKNEDQVQMLYQLMAIHPNEVALFFLEQPNFMAEFANLISLLIRKELYSWFSSGVINASVNAEKAAAASKGGGGKAGMEARKGGNQGAAQAAAQAERARIKALREEKAAKKK